MSESAESLVARFVRAGASDTQEAHRLIADEKEG